MFRTSPTAQGSICVENGAGILPTRALSQSVARATARGKFFFVGGEKLYVRGVTYGTFRPDAQGREFPRPDIVERDFAMMSGAGINALRTYTPAPIWLLD